LIELWSQLQLKIPQLFVGISQNTITPALLHGDLWSGNCDETDDSPGNCRLFPYGHIYLFATDYFQWYSIQPHSMVIQNTNLALLLYSVDLMHNSMLLIMRWYRLPMVSIVEYNSIDCFIVSIIGKYAVIFSILIWFIGIISVMDIVRHH